MLLAKQQRCETEMAQLQPVAANDVDSEDDEPLQLEQPQRNGLILELPKLKNNGANEEIHTWVWLTQEPIRLHGSDSAAAI